MGDQQFVLRWHYHETTLIHNLPYLLENDILSDVTLSVGAHQVKAHKIILAICSVYFLQLFQEMRNTQHPVVVLHNVSIDDVRAVLSFMYKGQCVVSKDQLPSLLSVAKLLRVQGLCDMKVPEEDVQDNISPIIDEKEQAEPFTNEDKFCGNTNYKCFKNIYEDSSDFKRQDEAADLSSKSKKSKISSSPQFWEKDVPGPVTTEENVNINEDQSHLAAGPKRLQNSKDSETCKCFLCGKYLSNQYNLRVHMETHEEAYHACQSCPHVSRSRDALRKHVSYRHPEEYQTRKRKKTDNT